MPRGHDVINSDLLLFMGRMVGFCLEHIREKKMSTIISYMNTNTITNVKLLGCVSLATIRCHMKGSA